VVGAVRNTGSREIAVVKLVINLTSNTGSQVGAVEATVEKLPPSGSKDFEIPIKQRNAFGAIVREIITP
jgi:hypothetical protein